MQRSHVLSSVCSLLLSFVILLPSAQGGKRLNGEFISKCFGCHGRGGVSGYSDFPNLAGQNLAYLNTQLISFRGGSRTDFTLNAMPYMVAGLDDTDLYGLAEIFSRYPSATVKKAEMTARDIKLFEVGKNIIASTSTTCRFCHLSNATADGPLSNDIPVLTGQQKNYLIGQIKAFRDKKRWSPIMNSDLIGQISDNDIEAIAVYMRYLKAQ